MPLSPFYRGLLGLLCIGRGQVRYFAQVVLSAVGAHYAWDERYNIFRRACRRTYNAWWIVSGAAVLWSPHPWRLRERCWLS
jgi:hypothetical protein